MLRHAHSVAYVLIGKHTKGSDVFQPAVDVFTFNVQHFLSHFLCYIQSYTTCFDLAPPYSVVFTPAEIVAISLRFSFMRNA
jgi:hypothetical protein